MHNSSIQNVLHKSQAIANHREEVSLADVQRRLDYDGNDLSLCKLSTATSYGLGSKGRAGHIGLGGRGHRDARDLYPNSKVRARETRSEIPGRGCRHSVATALGRRT
jgi:hypothetical protein